MSLRRLKNKTHKLFAGFMAIWLSGVVFLFCCVDMSAAAEGVESCPLAKVSPHCDKALTSGITTIVIAASEQSIDCCGFLPAIFDKTRKLEQVQKQPAAAQEKLIVPHFISPAIVHAPIVTEFQPYRGDHQKLFVRNCVFRI